MIEVDAGGLLALGVDDRADEPGDEHAALVGLGDEEVGRRAEGVGDEPTFGWAHTMSSSRRPLSCEKPISVVARRDVDAVRRRRRRAASSTP